MAVAQRIYARALFDAAGKERTGSRRCASELGRLRPGGRGRPRARRAPRATPSSTGGRRRDALEALLGGANQLAPQLPPARSSRRAASARSTTSQREFERSGRRRGGALEVELTTAYELSDEEAARDRAADRAGLRPEGRGHRVRVDPDLIGGIVLQAGSLRVDASVRGRLNGSVTSSITRR